MTINSESQSGFPEEQSPQEIAAEEYHRIDILRGAIGYLLTDRSISKESKIDGIILFTEMLLPHLPEHVVSIEIVNGYAIEREETNIDPNLQEKWTDSDLDIFQKQLLKQSGNLGLVNKILQRQ